MFYKTNSMVYDYFVMIKGEWVPNGKKLLIISVYALQELSEKKMLWDYLTLVIDNWNGEVVIMGDFNEVHKQAERYGSIFNVQGADAFNSFILAMGLEEVPLDFNVMAKLMKKMKYLKEKIHVWIKVKKDRSKNIRKTLKAELAKIDLLLDKGEGNSNVLYKRIFISKLLQELDKLESIEVAQKAKIKWAIKVDENSKYYHGILNKKRSQFAIRGILVDDDAVFMGHWSDSNIDTIVQVLECFYRASAEKIGCVTLEAPFSYLGSKINAFKVGLGLMPIYHMSLFKVPMKVIQRMESIRCHFFNGVDHNGKKPIWVKCSKVLASKEKGGLDVSSFYALNRALLFKWVWRVHTQGLSLWARVIKGIHSKDGKLGNNVNHSHPFIWLDIVREMEQLKNHGTDLIGFIYKKIVKTSHENIGYSLRQISREGIGQV
ncbi:RNA-directed DNA polymerase, eukaryota, reverse transcriptase zinc-binding domain protein [Tanacetum coccineum]